MPVRGLAAAAPKGASKKKRRRTAAQVSAEASKEQRSRARALQDPPFSLCATQGLRTPLENDAVEETSAEKYARGMQTVGAFLVQFGLALLPLSGADAVLTDFINYAWTRGLDFSEMANCISSVRDRFPQLSRHGDIRLPRVYRAWQDGGKDSRH